MLKALELFGFKSFADRTRFEFPAGITAIVGPNGSGKSNIVDAVKWVLGEQSVKSLRGMEMADVIFNGSENRRPMQSAEITLTFDNSRRVFPLDASEVHLTRRVYRSGESEYLINRQPCRLKDLRDLLAGTGLGTHAYCVIEQGRVDVLLQASSKDRRVLFEEAAGVSRFKAKKLEALRRLERVEQNLVRLRDIVEEVESRLRSVRQQAGKARRYQEYMDRLQALRTQVAWVDWMQWTEQLTRLEAEEAELSADRAQRAAEAESLETQQLELDAQIAQLHEAIRSAETQHAAYRERIAAEEAAVEHHRSQLRDLSEQQNRIQRQILALSVRTSDVDQQMQEITEALTDAQNHHDQLRQTLTRREQSLAEIDQSWKEIQKAQELFQSQQRQLLEQRARWESDRSRLEAFTAAAQQAKASAEQRLGELSQHVQEAENLCQTLQSEQETLERQAADRRQQIASADQRLDALVQQEQALQAEAHHLAQRQIALAERAALLEELLSRYEGVSPGVKDLLLQRQQSGDGPLRAVMGLLADLVVVSVEASPLVDIALGEWADFLVAWPTLELWEYLRRHAAEFPGRVGVLWLDPSPTVLPESCDDTKHLEQQPGVLGRADTFVQTEAAYQGLVRRLLGRTWIVESLEVAHRLAEAAPGCHFVTLAGERLSAEGVLEIGPRPGLAGGISRRSELRVLREELAQLKSALAELEQRRRQVHEEAEQCRQQMESFQAQLRAILETLGEHQRRLAAAEERLSQWRQQQEALCQENRRAEAQAEAVRAALAESASEGQRLTDALAEKDAELAALAQKMSQLQTQRKEWIAQITALQVELAKSQERLAALLTRKQQVEENRQERQRLLGDLQEQFSQTQLRVQQAQNQILQRQSTIAELYLAKESVAAKIRELTWTRQQWQQHRSELAVSAQQVWAVVRKIEEDLHSRQLAAGEVRQQRAALAQRFQEEYGIDLSALENGPPAQDGRSREEVQQEIEELRRKIQHLGNVNLEALEELQQLEARYEGLQSQYEDLAKAKASLERIIERINADSRRLFLETLETVRGHFHKLFRDLFGGGRADILLEEGVDVLESGVEIVARPPGKEPRSISLLSGGEKTLTCVALLLAIFRSRPSPFCVLDEVDAALDEANIDRFIQVLKDFLSITQFIIVTHSKKTMTCADTLYGVTMQESGVSKQVSVRFEDITEDGRLPHLESPSADGQRDPQAA